MQVAERVGFEPTIRLPAYRISSAAHSTSLPPLREDLGLLARLHGPVERRARLADEIAIAKCLRGDRPPLVHTTVVRFLVIHPLATYVPFMTTPSDDHRKDLPAGRSQYFSPQAGRAVSAPSVATARFAIGDVVRHRMHDFRGVVFDIDPVFAHSEEWYESIPMAVRPAREQPYYHLFAENDEASYVAYVSQQNLFEDGDGGPIDHPSIDMVFGEFDAGRYPLQRSLRH